MTTVRFANPASLVLTLLLLSLATPVSSTFLQWARCDDSRGSGAIPYYLNGELVRDSSSSSTSRLHVWLVKLQNGRTCNETVGTNSDEQDSWPTARVELKWLDWSGSHSVASETTMQLDCEDYADEHRPMPLDVHSSKVGMTLINAEELNIQSLSTIGLQARIDSPLFNETECIGTLLTPAETPLASSGLSAVPLAAFVFVFLVSLARTIASFSATTDLQSENAGAVSEEDNAAASLPILPSVYDCLHFLQFVFLTGGLSLAFPGFYPAAVGHLSGFALFANFAIPVRSFTPGPPSIPRISSAYPGVADGLYEVNGTYGGYPGFEVMAQMIRAPMTGDMWALMVLLVACIGAFLGIFLWCLELLRPRNILGLPMLSADMDTSRRARAARVGNGVLRLILSYFTMPLVALSSYQFHLTDYVVASHLGFAITFSVLILLAITWVAMRQSWDTLSALILDTGPRYQKLPRRDPVDDRPTSTSRMLPATIIVLNVTRGLILGGLQNSGIVQLVLLTLCELYMLSAAWRFRLYSLSSSNFLTTLLRLALLLCFVPSTFPPSQALAIKSAVSYAALGISALGLLGAFVIPSSWHLSRMVTKALNRNKTSRADQDPSAIILQRLHPSQASVSRRADATSPGHDTSPQGVDSDYFAWSYRTSRSRESITPGERTRYSWNETSRSRQTSPRPLLTPSPVGRQSPPARQSSSTSSSSPSSVTQIEKHQIEVESTSFEEAESSSTYSSGPLGPRWNDYSFREVDLYFGVPQQASKDPEVPESAPPSSLRASKWNVSPLGLRGLIRQNRTASAEKGFSVIRPPRPPPESQE